MSSTGRGADRRPDDLYETPAWAIDLIIPKLGPLKGQRIGDFGAGYGAISRRLIHHGATPERVHAVELDPGRAETCRTEAGCTVIQGDFLTMDRAALLRFDLSIQNPPFVYGEEFIRATMPMLTGAGRAAFLLRLAFCCAKSRRKLRRTHPFDFYPLERRPSFTAEEIHRLERAGADLSVALADRRKMLKKEGRLETIAEVRSRMLGTDSADYAWFVFGNGCGGRFEVLESPEGQEAETT